MTAFSWQGHGRLGDVAVEFTIDFGPENECSLGHTAHGYSPDTSLYNAVVYEGEAPWWYIDSDVVVAHGRVGEVNAEDIVAYPDGFRSHSYDTSFSHKVSLQGIVRITHIGNGVGAAEAGALTGPTMSIRMACDSPFTVQSAWLGRDVFLRDVQSMEEGVAAHATLVAHASVGSRATVELTGERVRIVALRGYFEASQVTVQAPAGKTSWLMTPHDWGRVDVLESRPGRHTLTVDRINAGYGAFSLAAYGLQEELELRQQAP